MSTRTVISLAVGVSLSSLVLSGLVACSSSSTAAGGSEPAGSSPSSGSAASGPVNVVASTNVWGDVVRQIAGTKARITSIVANPDADPHSYEASAVNQLEISKANIIVENGGGYDDFMNRMIKSAGSKATVLNAVDISGRTAPTGGDLNEHIWYDFPSVQKVVTHLVTTLSGADPADAGTFTANGAAFTAKLVIMEHTEAAIRAIAAGKGVAITEPVPLYMTDACGLLDKTPTAFSRAVEEGSDVAPRVLQQTLALFTDKQVSLLAYNEQTTGAATDSLLKAARANDIAIVPVTETLPAGQDYFSWMTGNLTAIRAAV